MTEQEFRTRVLPLQRLMYGTALKMGIPPDDAADTVQEAQVKLWRCRERIPPEEGELRLYCMATFRNECLQMLRRQRPTADIGEAEGLQGAEDTSVEYNDSRQRLEMLIDTLPQGQREAIRLCGFGGLETAEIAEVTGQTENNVRQLLSRGRRRLRELWAIHNS